MCAKKAEDSIEKSIAGFELRVGFFLGGMAGLVNSWEGGAGGWISGDHTVQYSIWSNNFRWPKHISLFLAHNLFIMVEQVRVRDTGNRGGTFLHLCSHNF